MEIPKETQDKMDELDKRINDARKDHFNVNDGYKKYENSESEDAEKSARAGSEFLSNVFAGAFIGYLVDWYFETIPLALRGFMLLGFVNGVLRANAAMKKKYEENNE